MCLHAHSYTYTSTSTSPSSVLSSESFLPGFVDLRYCLSLVVSHCEIEILLNFIWEKFWIWFLLR